MNGNGVYGFDIAEVDRVRDSALYTLRSLGEQITRQLQWGVINPLEENWFTTEAVEWITACVQVLNSYSQGIVNYYNAFLETMDVAVNTWGERTKNDFAIGHKYQPFEDSDCPIALTADGAVPEKNGQVGLNVDACLNLADSLVTIRDQLKQSCLQIQSRGLSNVEALLGGTQTESMRELFVKVGNLISEIFKNLTEGVGENAGLKVYIQNAAVHYKDLGDTTSTGLAGAADNTATSTPENIPEL